MLVREKLECALRTLDSHESYVRVQLAENGAETTALYDVRRALASLIERTEPHPEDV